MYIRDDANTDVESPGKPNEDDLRPKLGIWLLLIWLSCSCYLQSSSFSYTFLPHNLMLAHANTDGRVMHNSRNKCQSQPRTMSTCIHTIHIAPCLPIRALVSVPNKPMHHPAPQ